jgi:hypothetical protein
MVRTPHGLPLRGPHRISRDAHEASLPFRERASIPIRDSGVDTIEPGSAGGSPA